MSAIANAVQTDFNQINLAKTNSASAVINRANKTVDSASNVFNSKGINSDVIHTDVLIIGAGLAGLSTALALPKSLNITILSKAELQACSSHYAQGGIAASLDKADSVEDHVADTLIAGAGLCAVDNTTSILSAGQQAVQWLCEQGVPFTQTLKLLSSPNDSLVEKATKNEKGNEAIDKVLTIEDLHLTKEGGHGCRRVAHADDATGRHVMQALIAKAQTASNITILPFYEALSLLTYTNKIDYTLQNSVVNKANRCKGAIVYDHNHHRQLTIYSDAVVMASGGLGQLFARASAPNVCVGDGVMMAWQAGCRLANLEFVQFHPTGLALGDSSFLISEALRGEGGRLYCPSTGERFMLAIDERAELAPRDIVARAIAKQINTNGLGYVHLDVSHLPASFLREHFPQIYQTLLELGIDITTAAIPVAPTAHYSCGGIVTCANGLSDVKGLYAAGEVAYTGLHGANRLASNSLLECIVVGRNIAEHLPTYLTSNFANDFANDFANELWSYPTVNNAQTISLAKDNAVYSAANLASNKNKSELDTEVNIDFVIENIESMASSLKSLMSSHMGIVRDAKPLQQALLQLQHWQKNLDSLALVYDFNKKILADGDVSLTAQYLSLFKLARQVQLATLIVQSALQRHESRGGHYRIDFPDTDIMPLVSIIKPLVENSLIFTNSTENLTELEFIT